MAVRVRQGGQWKVVSGSVPNVNGNKIQYSTGQTLTNGTSYVDFTDVPTWAKRITVLFDNVSRPSGTPSPDYLIQLGTSSGFITSGYDSSSSRQDTNGNNTVSSTSGFIIEGGVLSGDYSLYKQNTITYVGSGGHSASRTSAGRLSSVSGTINSIRITTTSASFTGGTIQVIYEGDGDAESSSSDSNSNSSGGGSLIKHGTITINSTTPLTDTEAAFTNIPSTAKKITVSLYRFSYNTTDGSSDDIIMEVGDSSGYANSGYQSTYDSVNFGSNLNAKGSTTFYGLADDTTIGNDFNITIELVNITGNSWSISHQGGDSDDKVLHGGGSITLSNALDKLRIKTQNGRYLDNGIITVYYETEGSESGSGGSGGGNTINSRTERILTAGNGTYAFHPNLVYAKVYILGGGGYGGGSNHVGSGTGGSGGAGALAYRIYTAAEAGTSASYTIGASNVDSTFTVTGTASAEVLTAGKGGQGTTGTFGGGGATAYPIPGIPGINGTATNSFLQFVGSLSRDGYYPFAQGFGSSNGYGGVGTPAGSGPTGVGSPGGPGAMYIEEYYAISSTSSGTSGATPIGGIITWSGTIASLSSLSGWVLCDGQTTYSDILGNTATVPDLRDKFVVGAHSDGASGVTFTADTGAISGNYAPGNTGGSVAHQLTIAEMPRHRHTQWSLTDDHDADGSGSEVWRDQSTTDDYTGYAGGDDYHENRPPYYALAYIIRVS